VFRNPHCNDLLPGVLAGQHAPGSGVRPADRLGQAGGVQAVHGDRFRRLDRQRRAVQDFADQLQGRGFKLAGGHDPVDQAQLPGLLGIDDAAGQDQLHGLLQGDLPDDPVQAPAQGGQADLRLGEAEAGVGGGHHQIAGQQGFQAAAQGQAVDRGDDRLGQVETGGQAGEAAGRGVVAAASVQNFQVAAGAERAISRPGDHRDPGLGIGREAVEDRRELFMGRRMERVHDLRPVDGHEGDPAVAADGAELGCFHGRLPVSLGLWPRLAISMACR
jgi:hypothetical protein